ncbi:MAG TPA: malectin domain-containing carbohydrate-binding protein [Ferruginibacter sp.]|nr:malectin domain-containing carbohydrate-binding protein [Ferruginibacter sp.]
MGRLFVFLCALLSLWFNSFSQRQDILLNNNWQTRPGQATQWKPVSIPHNWDDYYGYRRLLHGNLHGNAEYKKEMVVKQSKNGNRFFLYFEGAGSYATVLLNGKFVGSHAGGRTTFTLDVTDVIRTDGTKNILEVKIAHPPGIKDLPWVCGGCSDERGFSEGSQPMGIFRPVHLIITRDVRIEPFGVHAWADIQNTATSLSVKATFKNYSQQNRHVVVVNQLVDATRKVVREISSSHSLKVNDSITISHNMIDIGNLTLWNIENPYLYKIVTLIKENNAVIDKTETDFGFRKLKWNSPSQQFILNGKPVFINGIAEYEHLLGQSHAFSNEQVIARIKWIQSAGFNAFRDGHQPHNLVYGKLCNEKGILWWTQLSAHVWYDTKEFRDHFKTLLREWVIERRNDPSVILWGLQNESKLPKEFAEECTALIRSLDPTASTQRLVTTCNGGEGTDWDVPQNWTGTYGGNPATYANDLKKQILVGEYGAWRTIDLHTEGGFVQNGILSEDRMTQLMEQKIRLAESVKDSVAGHFFWLLTSHDNPGRVQGGEGARELDRIGPVNYKGLLTPWEEPTDAYYMYRSNYADKNKEPMVYIVSHTWPNRWMKPGIKGSIYVYSNCDEVELFNDINNASLGKQKRNGIGTHFQWDKANIQYNVLYAVGYVNGKAVARDTIVLFHLPASPNFTKLYVSTKSVTKPLEGYNYIYRVNCGGADYKDEHGNVWLEDRAFNPEITGHGSTSWTTDFPGMPSFFASQRRTFAPIKNTKDWKLFQSFRYGKDKLKFQFDLEDGEYLVELYFIEPWLGIGGGMNAKGMRLFDVAVNGKIVLNDLDIWSEAGTNAAIKKTVKVNVKGGQMVISFPETKVGEALISAIAIAKGGIPESRRATRRSSSNRMNSWLDIGTELFAEDNICINSLPSNLFGAKWVELNSSTAIKLFKFTSYETNDLFIAIKTGYTDTAFLKGFENTRTEIITNEDGGKQYHVYRRRFAKGDTMTFTINRDMIVCRQPVNNMQPAFDLKPITSYRTNVALPGEGVIKEQFAGRECAVVRSDGKVTIEWPVQTGVADIYSITMKYFYGKEQPVNAKLQLIGAGQTMMLEEPVNFTFTREGKWNQFTINTGSMINAGNYTVKLIVENATGLAVSGIEVQ